MTFLRTVVFRQQVLHNHAMGSTLTPTFTLHHRLALALEVSGVTPEQMADALGMHVNSVHNYASGRREPKAAIVKVWAMETGVDLDWLRGDTGRLTPGYLWAPWYADMHDPPCWS